MSKQFWNRIVSIFTGVFLMGLGLFVIWPWMGFRAKPPAQRTMIVYGFSILESVMKNAVFPAFAKYWLQHTGERITFISSFAGSGTVTNQVIMGVPADLAILSLELDAHRLAAAGVVPSESWLQLPYQGTLNRTPFIILVREGNPLGIRDFEDLTKDGIGIVHPDPLTSGGANWAILAEYGAGLRTGSGHPEDGQRMLQGIWSNVVAQASSARAARTQFESGFGDALITYEQETLHDQRLGKLDGTIIYPSSTIFSEHTVVVIPRNVTRSEQDLVNAFVQFLWSEQAQSLFVQNGFRSVMEPLNEINNAFEIINDPFYVKDFGGWTKAHHQIVDSIWKNQVLKQVNLK